ncbi:hypothetical protein NVP1052A_34 [Vibrio phage 1.052.A._10N.286.46.C3]|nr:hypothetical protein NVP1052A_34 [Vibrio phage 1.052.A._10N.286.46.C3]
MEINEMTPWHDGYMVFSRRIEMRDNPYGIAWQIKAASVVKRIDIRDEIANNSAVAANNSIREMISTSGA